MRDRSSIATYTLMGLVIAVLAVFAYQRNQAYQSELSLWQDNAVKCPNDTRVLVNLSMAYKRLKMNEPGIAALQKAMEIDPSLIPYFAALKYVYKEGGVLITERDPWKSNR